MRKNVFNLIFKMWSIIILCSVILIGCETSGNSIPPQIRPAKIDLNGVRGFAVVENSSNAAETRADGEESSYSHSLYTIDENGELHIAIFYFEVVPSEGGGTENSKTEVIQEVSNALQVVPSLVSDLGKYILFSGCRYEINDIIMSDEARAICERYKYNSGEHMTFLIRKSDGALFNLYNQYIFTYSYFIYYYYDNYGREEYSSSYFHSSEAFAWHIPTDKYMTSRKGNLYTIANDIVYQIVDNGNAIDVKQMTQNYWGANFIVDANENIYIDAQTTGGYLDVYLSNGKFDVIDMREYLFKHMKYDDNNIAYLFYVKGYYDDEKGKEVGVFTASTLLDGKCIERNKTEIVVDEWWVHYYIGYSNGDFKWLLSSALKILTYNKDRDEWILEDIPEDLRNIYTEKYDLLLSGIKSYGVNVKGNTIEINEIDLVNKSYRQYSFDVDISFIKAQSYYAAMANETPYLFISGKNSESGAGVSFMINLANGENNSTFATDNRNVVSFFRIN